MLNSPDNRARTIALFPDLATDPSFEIVDQAIPSYNCIAWAANRTDIWWQPLPLDQRPAYSLDGIKIDWPFDAPFNTLLTTYTFVFSNLGYDVCTNGNYEIGFRKICLYGRDDQNMTHAARQLVTGNHVGLWTSKLGRGYRIIHASEHSIVNGPQGYGPVLQYMKVKWP